MDNYRDQAAGAVAPTGRVGTAVAGNAESAGSGVSWGAIFAGAVGATALSLVLLLLGTGLGFASISPWADQGAGAKAVGVAAVLWLTFTAIAASGMGGYLAGRLRTRWAALHTDEVYFRDTAHGFLAWAVATVMTAGLLASVVGSIVGTGAKAGASVVGGAASTAMAAGAGAVGSMAGDSGTGSSGASSYFVDSLFRRDASQPAAMPTAPATAPTPDANATSGTTGTTGTTPATGAAASTTGSSTTASSMQGTASSTAEIGRIFANSLRTGALPADDVKYVGQVVAQRTGLSQADAEKRVSDVYAKAQTAIKDAETKAREAAEAARKASTYAALWMVVSMLLGAFAASLAATYGGRRRDL